MHPISILCCLVIISQASAQTWFTGNPDKDGIVTVKEGYLITKTPIKVLDPPTIDRMEVSWDRTVAQWKIVLTSNKPLAKFYKPCRFAFDGWHSYTVGAGDRDGGSFLMLIPKSYKHAIKIRDALAKQLKLPARKVSTEPIEAEKILN